MHGLIFGDIDVAKEIKRAQACNSHQACHMAVAEPRV